jgi:hypothetical protein
MLTLEKYEIGKAEREEKEKVVHEFWSEKYNIKNDNNIAGCVKCVILIYDDNN